MLEFQGWFRFFVEALVCCLRAKSYLFEAAGSNRNNVTPRSPKLFFLVSPKLLA